MVATDAGEVLAAALPLSVGTSTTFVNDGEVNGVVDIVVGELNTLEVLTELLIPCVVKFAPETIGSTIGTEALGKTTIGAIVVGGVKEGEFFISSVLFTKFAKS